MEGHKDVNSERKQASIQINESSNSDTEDIIISDSDDSIAVVKPMKKGKSPGTKTTNNLKSSQSGGHKMKNSKGNKPSIGTTDTQVKKGITKEEEIDKTNSSTKKRKVDLIEPNVRSPSKALPISPKTKKLKKQKASVENTTEAKSSNSKAPVSTSRKPKTQNIKAKATSSTSKKSIPSSESSSAPQHEPVLSSTQYQQQIYPPTYIQQPFYNQPNYIQPPVYNQPNYFQPSMYNQPFYQTNFNPVYDQPHQHSNASTGNSQLQNQTQHNSWNSYPPEGN